MANTLAKELLEDKRKKSAFITLNDGDDIVGEVVAIKNITKPGYSGEETEVIRTILSCEIDGIGVMNKNFDNGSNRWLKAMVESEFDVGDVIKITRDGEGPKTSYKLEIVSKKGGEQVALEEEPTPEETPEAPIEE